ncbi:MAG: bifunctional glycosyltransferase/class I SAM-dependent methyltransferase [Kiritimatiellae bacterium]|nr:bifunctional glycosyltransferase/class I SAM-dependent methyltransferase [Kiritimatiellia bacterium]MDW8458684.1 bifunctional glycosyltransferase/class I SAM-dependent methyltransferase [Verrucomicrobiota bacterium]
MRIGIFVIAYNAERHIAKTLSRIPADLWKAIDVVYVIDDCSTDDTTRVALGFKPPIDPQKFVVLRNRVNQRYGGNQKLGYQYAIDRGLDVVVMLHADGQYAPEVLPQLLEPIIRDEADVVLGSRMIHRADARKGGMPLYKFVGNIVLTKIENALSGMRLSEFHSGYRAYRVDFLKTIPIWENSDEWHFDTQILFQAHGAGARIREIPIPTYYGDEICHVNGIIYGLNCVLSALAFFLHKSGFLYVAKYDVEREGHRYPEKFADPGSSHSLLWSWLTEQNLRGARVLELGVGDAALTRRLWEAGAIVDGVELSESSARRAAPYCRRVLQSDLNDFDRLEIEPPYDICVAADVLEHLHRPEYVLSRLKRAVRRGGRLYVSLPNVANLYVRLNLLFGRFPRTRRGPLDETHLHFYTFRDMRRLLAKTGWVIRREAPTSMPVPILFPFFQKPPFSWVWWVARKMTNTLPGLLGYQGLFVCENTNSPDLL